MDAGVSRPTVNAKPPPPQSQYTYTPFQDANSIRILTLHPGTGSDPLVGELTTESLATEPLFEAVSYVWGSTDRTTHLTCNGRILPITSSVRNAVSRMRHPSEPRRLWADQICINQEDVAERSRQVLLMNAVYKSARHVLVWLGGDRDGVAQDAMDMVHYLDGVFGDEAAHEEFRRAHSVDLGRQSREPWVPLAKLTKLPWFHRIWIIQEIGTATPATLFWGPSQIDWEKLSHVTGVLNEQYHYLRTRFSIGTPNIRYLYRRFVEPDEYGEQYNRGNFIYELHRARHLLSRDPRDKVYAFLGHYSLQCGSRELAGLEADYSRPVEDVYFDVAVRGLKGARSLMVLSANYNAPDGSVNSLSRKPVTHGGGTVNIPSWVPDWRVLPVHIMGSPDTAHRAAGDTEPSLEIDEAKRILHIRGLRIDSIARRSWVFYGKAFHFQKEQRRQQPLESLWRDVCGYRYRHFSLSIRYREAIPAPYSPSDNMPNHGSESAFFALVQTLTNGFMGFARTMQYDSIPPSQWLSHGAAYLVRCGVWHDNITPEIHDAARDGDAFTWSHRATLVTRYRRFAVTNDGYYVMGPEGMEDGDIIVVLYGGSTPYALRKAADGDGWLLVGECYVHGMMNGEVLTREGVEVEVFSII